MGRIRLVFGAHHEMTKVSASNAVMASRIHGKGRADTWRVMRAPPFLHGRLQSDLSDHDRILAIRDIVRTAIAHMKMQGCDFTNAFA